MRNNIWLSFFLSIIEQIIMQASEASLMPEALQVVAEDDGLRVTLILQKYLYLHFRIRTSSKSSKSSDVKVA